MYRCLREELEGYEGERYQLQSGDKALSYAGFIDALINDEALATYLTQLLAASTYQALRWECLPVTAATESAPFEFVALNAPDLIGPADRTSFRDLFAQIAPDGVGEFPNLGNDARMVVPGPSEDRSYGHFAEFLRNAPEPQQAALWKAIGVAAKRRMGARPMWLSTAGGGVAWLHVRLDDRPKYYVYKPYRTTL